MGEISKSIGKTVLFVSHNMDSVRNFCEKSLVLKNGMVQHYGSTEECIRVYGEAVNINKFHWSGNKGSNGCILKSTKIFNLNNTEFDNSDDIYIEIVFEVKVEIRDLVIGFNLFSKSDEKLACCVADDYNTNPTILYKPGIFLKKFKIPSWTLAEGGYKIKFDLGIHNLIKIIGDDGELIFDVTNKSGNGRRFLTEGSRMHNSIIRANWEIQ
jgi:lipopolysaccharide transport system ATP-binding protein